MDSGKAVYGVNTGFGDNVRYRIGDDQLAQLQENILRSHACSTGRAMSRDEVRGNLIGSLVRAGYSYSGSLTSEALQCTDKHFDPRLLNVKRHTESSQVGDWIRGALAGSAIMERARETRIQDAVCIRLIPHLMGAVIHQITDVCESIRRELASVVNTSVSAGQEAPNSRSDSAARKLVKVTGKLRSLVALTMMTAVQALDFIDLPASDVNEAARKEIRRSVTFMDHDDRMYERIEKMERVIDSGVLLDIYTEQLGPFPL